MSLFKEAEEKITTQKRKQRRIVVQTARSTLSSIFRH